MRGNASNSQIKTSELLLFTRRFDRQLDDHSVADQIIGFAGIIDAKVFAIDRELGVRGNTVRGELNRRRKADRFLYAVKIEIAGDGVRRAIGRVWFDLR